MRRTAPPDLLSRRQLALATLEVVGAAAVLAACGRDRDRDKDSAELGDTGPISHVDWATGGTAVMAADYPDPFDAAVTDCTMVCAMMLGPCYAETLARQDISEGAPGLPMRLALRIVDTDCNPVEGAEVDIWHAAVSGRYSGDDAPEMCTNGESTMTSGRAFRGTQATDERGRVDFSSCFPGWYPSRAVHIHLTIRRDGKAYVTSQLFFPQGLIDEICTVHPEYSGRGLPDTPSTRDTVLGDNDPALYTARWRQADDGVLIAYKTVTIRAALSEVLCAEFGQG